MGENCIKTSLVVCITHRNINTVIKLKSIRWEGHVARTAQIRSAYEILVRTPEEGNQFEYLGVDGKQNEIPKACFNTRHER
jgi:hypothetical protein